MEKYKINLYLTRKGWQIDDHYDEMWHTSVTFQKQYRGILDILSEKMSKRDKSLTSQFKIVLSFRPQRHGLFDLNIDYSTKSTTSALYRKLGMDLYNVLCEELSSNLTSPGATE